MSLHHQFQTFTIFSSLIQINISKFETILQDPYINPKMTGIFKDTFFLGGVDTPFNILRRTNLISI